MQPTLYIRRYIAIQLCCVHELVGRCGDTRVRVALTRTQAELRTYTRAARKRTRVRVHAYP